MNKEMCKKIKSLRLQAGFSQSEMAEKIHMSQSSYQRLENGRTNTWSMYAERIAAVFGMTEEELYLKKNTSPVIADEKHKSFEKLILLYESLVHEKENRIHLLEEKLMNMHVLIADFKDKSLSKNEPSLDHNIVSLKQNIR